MIEFLDLKNNLEVIQSISNLKTLFNQYNCYDVNFSQRSSFSLQTLSLFSSSTLSSPHLLDSTLFSLIFFIF
jgi:hypothetical protein